MVQPRVALLAMGLMSLIIGCNGGTTTTPQVPTKTPEGEVTPSGDDEATTVDSTPTSPSTATSPTSSAAERYASSNGQISAPRPAGDDWECVEQISEDPVAALIKCRQRERGRFFFMMAKEYQVPAAEVRSLDGIIGEVLPQTYAKLFTSYKITRDEPTMVGSVPARDLWIEAEHASMGSIRKRERMMIQGERVFVVSAEGLATLFDGFAPAIDAWFAGVTFTNLR